MQITVGFGYDRIRVKQDESQLSIGRENIMHHALKYERIAELCCKCCGYAHRDHEQPINDREM